MRWHLRAEAYRNQVVRCKKIVQAKPEAQELWSWSGRSWRSYFVLAPSSTKQHHVTAKSSSFATVLMARPPGGLVADPSFEASCVMDAAGR